MKNKINPDAKEKTIKLFENRLKGIEQSLKMRGITDYTVSHGTIELKRGDTHWQYSVLKHKWNMATNTKGQGIDSFIRAVEDV